MPLKTCILCKETWYCTEACNVRRDPDLCFCRKCYLSHYGNKGESARISFFGTWEKIEENCFPNEEENPSRRNR